MLPWTTVAIAGPSMEPSTRSGDWWVVRRTRRIRPGDLVAFHHPRRPTLIVVKRAVRAVDSAWWFEGDNPSSSDDSRTFGAVPAELVIGRLVWRYRTASG